MRKQIKLREKEVEYCLANFPETRNSDITLLIKIWETYHSQYLLVNAAGKQVVETEMLHDLPREDAVKRIRAKFNSKRKYLPTSEKVARKRQMNITEWRAWLAEEGKEPELVTFDGTKQEPVNVCSHGLPLFVACPNCKTV